MMMETLHHADTCANSAMFKRTTDGELYGLTERGAFDIVKPLSVPSYANVLNGSLLFSKFASLGTDESCTMLP